MSREKKKFDWEFLVYVLLLVFVVGWTIASMVSYMSLNNWDIRCAFSECRPITVRGEE